MATYSSILAWKTPWTGARQAAVHGVAKVGKKKKKEQLGVRELVNSLLGAHTEHQPSAQWASEQAYICGLGDKW